MRLLLFMVGLLLLPVRVSEAQSLTGRVIDAVTREPLPGANVVVLGAEGVVLGGAATDLDGAYRVAELPTGAYRVRASFVGYDPQVRTDGDLRLGPGLTLGLGGGARETIETAFFQRATPATPFDQDLRFATDLGLWKGFGYAQLTTRLLRDRLALTAGLRADATDFLDQLAVLSPRVSASSDLTDRWEVSAAVGRFTQSPELISLAVRDESDTYVNRGLQWIDVAQVVGGLAVTPIPSLRVSLEGFYVAGGLL